MPISCERTGSPGQARRAVGARGRCAHRASAATPHRSCCPDAPRPKGRAPLAASRVARRPACPKAKLRFGEGRLSCQHDGAARALPAAEIAAVKLVIIHDLWYHYRRVALHASGLPAPAGPRRDLRTPGRTPSRTGRRRFPLHHLDGYSARPATSHWESPDWLPQVTVSVKGKLGLFMPRSIIV